MIGIVGHSNMSTPINNVHGVEVGLWRRIAEVCKTRKTIFMLRNNMASALIYGCLTFGNRAAGKAKGR